MRGKVLLSLGVASVIAANGLVAREGAGQARAADLQFRMVVPGLALDSGTAAGVTAGHVSLRNDGGLVVTGDVTNGSSSVVSHVQLLVHATVGGVATTRQTSALVNSLKPGATAPFRVQFALPGDIAAGATVEVLGFETTALAPASGAFTFAGPYPFQVGPPDPKTGVIPYSSTIEELRGQVTNTGSRPLRAIEVLVAIYDGAGNVAWVGSGNDLQVPFEVAGVPQQLEVGQTGTFIVGIPIGLLASVPGHVTFQGFLNASVQ